MDRNSLTGVILIVIIVIGYNMLFPPVVDVPPPTTDSVSVVLEKEVVDNTVIENTPTLSDSSLQESNKQVFGVFYPATKISDEIIQIENEKLVLSISSKGGRIISAILKDFQTSDSLPLNLIDRDSSQFNITFFSEGNRIINTQDLYFQATNITDRSVSMRMMASNGGYVEFQYRLKDDDYMLDFGIHTSNLESIIPTNRNEMELSWVVNLPHTEKSIDNERMYSTVYYKYLNDDVDYLSTSKDDQEELSGKAQWVGLKHQFFSTVLINNNGFEKPTTVSVATNESSQDFVKKLSLNTVIPFQHRSTEVTPYQLYFGPNHYETLKEYNMDLERMIPLGWGIFRWVNKYAVIPIFNWLDNSITNYGIIILIMTLIIKLCLSPFTLKAYKSQAKMKVLKPEIDKINEKFKGKDPMKAQQETMALYKKTGVNPLGGCIPMLLQMPILFALFRFFPASIELRQKSFLWADDLSSYDSVFSLPFEIPFYGDHVSLFTLLMTISTLLYTRMNSQMSGPQMAQMKWMMYLMPIMFLGFFNNYAAGLSYYYFLANMVTFGQQFVMRKYFIDEAAILATMEQNKKKPVKKSSFQKRLEDMAKRQQEVAKKRKK